MSEERTATYKGKCPNEYRAKANNNILYMVFSGFLSAAFAFVSHDNINRSDRLDSGLLSQAQKNVLLKKADSVSVPATAVAGGKEYQIVVTDQDVQLEIQNIREMTKMDGYLGGATSLALGLGSLALGVGAARNRRDAKRAREGWDQQEAAKSSPVPKAPAA